MEEKSEQEPQEETFWPPYAPEYITIKEAAAIMGVSERSVYGYTEDGSLAGFRVSKQTVVRKTDVLNYQRKAPGRLRTSIPSWHVPPVQNLPYLTNITVRVRPGQGERLDNKLDAIRVQGKHCLPGTVARYITRNQNRPDEIQIILVWRSAVMPSSEEREAGLAALRNDLAEILDWETAVYKECRVLMHA